MSLRLRRDGKTAVTEMPSNFDITATKEVDDILENYLGIRDSEMATSIVEVFKEKSSHMADFAELLKTKFLVDLISENEKLLYTLWSKLGELKRANPAHDLSSKNNFEDESD